jgi:hypothetical protein
MPSPRGVRRRPGVTFTRPDGAGWAADPTKPYRELGEQSYWVSSPGPLGKDRHPVDVFDRGNRRKNMAAAAEQGKLLMTRLTGSKTQQPVEVALTRPAQVPVPPSFDELQHQLAYGDRRLRACRAGMDVVSHMAAMEDHAERGQVRTDPCARRGESAPVEWCELPEIQLVSLGWAAVRRHRAHLAPPIRRASSTAPPR